MKYFDLHCDTATELYDGEQHLKQNDLHLSLDRASGLEPWCQCFAVFINDETRGEAAVARYRACVAHFRQEVRNNGFRIRLCANHEDFMQLPGKNICTAILTVENGAALGGSFENLALMARDGVRMMTLTWNGANEIAGGCRAGGGLTPFGSAVIWEMNRLGIAVDVSHLCDESFWQVLSKTQAPPIASHSNLRAVCGHPRNLTDAQFRAIADYGGIVGLNYFVEFLSGDTAKAQSIKMLFSHVDRMLALGGEKVIALGSDFDGARMPDFCKGIQDIPALYGSFLERYGSALTDDIFFYNAARYFQILSTTKEVTG